MSSTTGISKQNVLDFLAVTPPGNPPANQARLFFNGTNLVAINSTGSSVLAGGGGGSPGGADTNIQFNDSGSFGGDANLTWSKASGSFSATADHTGNHALVAGSTGSNFLEVTGEDSSDGNGFTFQALETNAAINIESYGHTQLSSHHGSVFLTDSPGNPMIEVTNDSKIGFFGATAVVKPNLTGSKGGNAALASLIAAGVALGLWTDSTT